MAGLKALAAGAASLLLAKQAAAQAQIINDTYFYGQSEPVYPTPQGQGLGDWAAAYSQAHAFVAQLTIEEKTNLTGGYAELNGCSGNIYAIERLGFPGLCVTDAGNGVRATDFVNGYASGIHVGASWNKALTHQRGVDMGGEFRTKGVNIQLGPVVGPLGRIAEGGRNWEGFSADPYLGGKLVAQHITGLQSNGVGACTKHFIGNEQETDRNPTISSQNETVESVSSNIDDTTLHELYLWPFAEAVRAGTVSIMCSYNRLNNSYACQNSKSLNGILKTELGFQGFVMSDWFAQHSGVASAEAGMDMVMPSGLAFWGPNLTEAVENGTIAESRLDDMATRVMATWYYTNQDSGYPARGVGMPADLLAPHQAVNARKPSAAAGLLQAAVEGHVLVKNTNNALPLKSPQLLSIYGYDAVGTRYNTPTPGLSSWALGLTNTDTQSVVCGFGASFGPCTEFTGYAINGTLYTGGGSGSTTPAYISAPLDAIQQRAIEDGGPFLLWDTIDVNATSSVDAASDACLVFINAESSEGVDRPNLHDSFSDDLVTNIANQCANTIVTIHNAGVRLVDTWIDHPNVTAVIFAHLPGQDSGRALVSILYGDVSPSGKLPYTVARNESDYGSLLAPVPTPEEGSEYSLFPQDTFSEGVFIDYRRFDAQNISPRYEFGFGLTYTTFGYSDISISKEGSTASASKRQVSQISDGQPQAATSAAAPVSQISDGQPQAATASAVSQISDGQPQAPKSSAAPVSQISDGQPQAPASSAAPVSQISDGQPQAPASSAAAVSQISDGQPQAPASATSSAAATQTSSGSSSSGSLSAYPTGAIVPGGASDLFDTLVTVTATITNTGSVAAAEIGQLYLSIPAAGQPVRQLRGFEKVMLQPGASQTVSFELQRRDLSVWDVVAQQWKLIVGGTYTVSVGASSRDLPLVGTFTL